MPGITGLFPNLMANPICKVNEYDVAEHVAQYIATGH